MDLSLGITGRRSAEPAMGGGSVTTRFISPAMHGLVRYVVGNAHTSGGVGGARGRPVCSGTLEICRVAARDAGPSARVAAIASFIGGGARGVDSRTRGP